MSFKCTVIELDDDGRFLTDCDNMTDEEVDLEDMEAVNESLTAQRLRLVGSHICDEHAEGVEI